MKILLKILCAPMIAVLSVFVWLASKLVQISAVVMNFIAIAVGLGALCILFDGKTAQGYKMSRPNVQKILYKNVQLVCLS